MHEKSPEKYAQQILRQFTDIPIGLCSFDLDLRYLYINQWLAERHGVAADNHIGKTLREMPEIGSYGVRTDIEGRLRQVISTCVPIIDGTTQAQPHADNDGSIFYRHSYYPDFDDDGELIGVCVLVQEVLMSQTDENALQGRLERIHSVLSGPPAGYRSN